MRRAAETLRAYVAAGLLGSDPELIHAVADLCGFAEQGGDVTEADELRETLVRERAAHAEYRARAEADREQGLRRVRELERIAQAQGDKMLIMSAALSRAAERRAEHQREAA